jgi:zinc transport system substrate-binding protein
MRRLFIVLAAFIAVSCSNTSHVPGEKYITVSIGPFKYFIESIAGDDFKVNVMVPAGSNPHIYEPFPEQISRLGNSVAYISNGYLGFEMTWLDRFYETNRSMKKLSLGDKIDPIDSDHHHDGDHIEGADPHYWVSPKCALVMASSLLDFLCGLNPQHKEIYESNYQKLVLRIKDMDRKAREMFSGMKGRAFMIYHPNLAYLARDYGLEEIPVEFQGKEPSALRMKELIDRARKDHLNTIFVQREYDTKNARAIAAETGSVVKVIDPLSEDWPEATMNIINGIHDSLAEGSK